MNRQQTNSENTIATLFIEILIFMSSTWSIREHTMKPLVENSRKFVKMLTSVKENEIENEN